jgi:pyruvate/2-oxoglutarate dehydrogenase complex dihydrolipoamide acyltransferase (E2) component
MTTRLPNDSAISVATSDAHNLEHHGSKTQEKAPKTSTDQQVRKSNSNSPHNTPHEPSHPNPQVAQELEAASAAEQAQNENEIDSGFSDNASVSDAGYETDSLRSASTSISPSVRDYAFENGRRYHKFREGSYNFPNDDSEQDREDMKHAMMVNLCQRLHFADLGDKAGNGMNVLDMGTGTGIWAIESESSFLQIRERQRERGGVNG